MRVQSLRWEDPLEEGTATHSSILAWRIPDRGAWRATAHRVTKSQTQLIYEARTHAHLSTFLNDLHDVYKFHVFSVH